MCGIAGYWGSDAPPEGRVRQTLERMKRRGPDVQAHVEQSDDAWAVQLLHSRLSILDLDPRSNQPFRIGNQVLVFNGEIYNYLELRKELETAGETFLTESDTEVLLRCYQRYGRDCVKRFEGMWAFAIYDGDRKELFLSRDRFGEKPLYIYRDGKGFYFASEVKLIQSLTGSSLPINERQLQKYLFQGYRALHKTSETFFRGVTLLPQATGLVLRQGDVEGEPSRFWEPRISVNQEMEMEAAVEGARERLRESMRIRLRSDVPLAFCLSGGVDSASLVSIAAKEFGAKLHAFSIIDSDERYNEEANILATVQDTGCEHTLIHLNHGEDALANLRDLVAYHDAPIATISYYIHSLILREVNRNDYRVTFSGTAADELFTGYYDHFLLHLAELKGTPHHEAALTSWQTHIAPLVRNPLLRNPDLYVDRPHFREHLFDAEDEVSGLLKVAFKAPFEEHNFEAGLLRGRMLNELFHEVIPVILQEDDLNSMYYSVENRSPYLDSGLFEFCCSIPPQHLIQNGYAKSVLRQAMDGILNDQVRLDRHKKGFNAAIQSIVNLQSPEVQAELLDGDSVVFDWLDREGIRELFLREQLPNSLSKFLFNFINARLFLEQN